MVRVFGHLVKHVIEPGYCVGCGSCIASCPVQCLARENEAPVLKGVCINCGICYGMCPQTIDPKILQSQVFGQAAADDLLGTYIKALSVETKDPSIKARSQDGGAVMTLLGALLDSGYVDSVVVTGSGDSPWIPVARVATTVDELINCAGTKYSTGPTSIALRDAVRLFYSRKVALVGTPPQIIATRRMVLSSPTNAHLADAIKLRIGLFCGGVFKYGEFFEGFIEKKLNIPLSEVAKFDMRGDKFLIYIKKKPMQELPLSEVKEHFDLPSRISPDFTAEFADISVGSAGSPAGRSSILLRTNVGAEALDIVSKSERLDVVDLDKVRPGIEAIRQDAGDKKAAVQKALEDLRKRGKLLPIWMQQPGAPSTEPIEPVTDICPI